MDVQSFLQQLTYNLYLTFMGVPPSDLPKVITCVYISKAGNMFINNELVATNTRTYEQLRSDLVISELRVFRAQLDHLRTTQAIHMSHHKGTDVAQIVHHIAKWISIHDYEFSLRIKDGNVVIEGH